MRGVEDPSAGDKASLGEQIGHMSCFLVVSQKLLTIQL
jgi:hypothetical protein